MEFELPKDKSSIIKVIGVGGGGSNAVNHMFKQGIKGVDFIVCNTDAQALDISPVPTKIQLGAHLTEGLGAGSIPEVGKNAAIETIDEIRKILSVNTKMLFITAGMGGGTGTGAAPIIASVAKEMGILTVGIVTVPFAHEGKKRKTQANEGIEQMKKNVDTLLVINNDKLREIYGNLKLSESLVYADNILSTAARSIAEIITVTLHINVDFADIQTVMKDSGRAIMGSAVAAGENRAIKAVEMALNSPLLNDSNIVGARYVLLNIVSGNDEITMDEYGEIMDFVQDAAGQTAEIIKGYGVDETLGDQVRVTIIATGFQEGPENTSHSLTGGKKILLLTEHDTEVEAPEVNIIPSLEPQLKTIVTPEAKVEESPEPKPSIQTEASAQPLITDDLFVDPVRSEIDENPYAQEKAQEDSGYEFVLPAAAAQDFVNKINDNEQHAMDLFDEPRIISKVAPAQPERQAAPEVDQAKRAQDRISQLRAVSMKFNSPNGVNELEKEPAYIRRAVKLENARHSSESEISRFTLGEDENKNPSIKPNNSFLHDSVD